MDDITHDIKRLRPTRPVTFSPGQYATLQFPPQHISLYSMAGLCTEAELEFHVRILPGGFVSDYVTHSFKPGDAISLTGPLGAAFLRSHQSGPMLCVAGDIYCSAWLDQLGKSQSNLHIHVVAHDTQCRFGRGGAATDAIAADWTRLDGWRPYLYGSPSLVEVTSLLVERIGVDPGNIYADTFYAST